MRRRLRAFTLDVMLRVAGVVLVLLTPTLVGAAVLGGIRLYRRLLPALRARRAGAVPVDPPIERIAADLRRLRQVLLRLEDAPDTTVGRSVRLRALRSAYGDTLLAACRALDVPTDCPADAMTRPQMYRLEAILRDRGLDVDAAMMR